MPEQKKPDQPIVPPAFDTRGVLARFDEASRHPYACRCSVCLEWWNLVPPEDEDEENRGSD